jgi:hypothetical protein
MDIQLLHQLDRTFGFKPQKSSSVTKTGQRFDEKANEHVITLEYRVRAEAPGTSPRLITALVPD